LIASVIVIHSFIHSTLFQALLAHKKQTKPERHKDKHTHRHKSN